jgi:hypothetical protein
LAERKLVSGLKRGTNLKPGILKGCSAWNAFANAVKTCYTKLKYYITTTSTTKNNLESKGCVPGN